jgi:hypothetical protein
MLVDSAKVADTGLTKTNKEGVSLIPSLFSNLIKNIPIFLGNVL